METMIDRPEQIIRFLVHQMHDAASEETIARWDADRSGYLDEIALQYDYTDGATTISRDALEAYVRAIEDADYSIYDYDSGSLLDGPPSADLVEASFDAAPEGAVMAVWDGDEWIHIPDCEESQARARGEEPRCIYVQE